jgi:hypothetical protein
MILARQRAFERLRGRDAISYQVDCLHLRIGGDQALEALSADGAPGNFAQVLDGLVEAVTEMASTGPDAEKLEELKRMYREAATHPEYVLGEMDSTAERCLLGLPTPTAEESDEKLQALTPDQLRDELAGLLPSLLAVGPNDLGEELPEWSTYVTWSRDSLEGRRYEPVAGREEGSLIVGNDGLSWELDDERRRTVLWADAAACFTWDSGQRSVIGPAGAYVDVLPWNWQNGQDLTQTIDGSVDQRLLIRLGEGQATYLQKRDDPDSVADLHWLGSVVGALHGQKRVDLLIETHGLYLLYGRTRTPRARLKELRAKDRGELLAEDPRNRWVPWSQVDRARLAGRFLAPIDDVKASLTIWCTGERALKVLLRNKAQVETLRGELPRVLGDRFKS